MAPRAAAQLAQTIQAAMQPAQTAPASATTTVFMSGNSQAVRIPKNMRIHSRKVHIERQGNMLIIEEIPQTVGDVFANWNGIPDFPEFDDASDLPPEAVEDL